MEEASHVLTGTPLADKGVSTSLVIRVLHEYLLFPAVYKLDWMLESVCHAVWYSLSNSFQMSKHIYLCKSFISLIQIALLLQCVLIHWMNCHTVGEETMNKLLKQISVFNALLVKIIMSYGPSVSYAEPHLFHIYIYA